MPSASAEPSAELLLAGGETSEFSGGDVVYGYCPVVAARTKLDLARDDVKPWVAIAQGHHESSLIWRRRFPDVAIRGFEQRTTLLLDVEVLGAEDVDCRARSEETGYEAAGYQEHLRRLELAVTFSTADGALHGAFRAPFVASTSVAGERDLSGRATLPFEGAAGTLELGVAELQPESLTLGFDLTLAAGGMSGSLQPRVTLPGPPGAKPNWVPVAGAFPAPDEGCEVGTWISLDEVAPALGDTPRAGYERARAQLPTTPIQAVWEDFPHFPVSFSWTTVTVGAGEPQHACRNGDWIDVYTSWSLASADGRLSSERAIIASLSPALSGSDPSRTAARLRTQDEWVLAADFARSTGVRQVELSDARSASLQIEGGFADQGQLGGKAHVAQWVSYANLLDAPPALHWCSGGECEAYWCSLTWTDACPPKP